MPCLHRQSPSSVQGPIVCTRESKERDRVPRCSWATNNFPDNFFHRIFKRTYLRMVLLDAAPPASTHQGWHSSFSSRWGDKSRCFPSQPPSTALSAPSLPGPGAILPTTPTLPTWSTVRQQPLPVYLMTQKGFFAPQLAPHSWEILTCVLHSMATASLSSAACGRHLLLVQTAKQRLGVTTRGWASWSCSQTRRAWRGQGAQWGWGKIWGPSQVPWCWLRAWGALWGEGGATPHTPVPATSGTFQKVLAATPWGHSWGTQVSGGTPGEMNCRTGKNSTWQGVRGKSEKVHTLRGRYNVSSRVEDWIQLKKKKKKRHM